MGQEEASPGPGRWTAGSARIPAAASAEGKEAKGKAETAARAGAAAPGPVVERQEAAGLASPEPAEQA